MLRREALPNTWRSTHPLRSLRGPAHCAERKRSTASAQATSKAWAKARALSTAGRQHDANGAKPNKAAQGQNGQPGAGEGEKERLADLLHAATVKLRGQRAGQRLRIARRPKAQGPSRGPPSGSPGRRCRYVQGGKAVGPTQRQRTPRHSLCKSQAVASPQINEDSPGFSSGQLHLGIPQMTVSRSASLH